MREGLAAAIFATLLAAALPGPAHSSEDTDNQQNPVTAETAKPPPPVGRPIALHVNRRPAKPQLPDKEQAAADTLRTNQAPQTYTGIIQ
jgi:hypothetical protein